MTREEEIRKACEEIYNKLVLDGTGTPKEFGEACMKWADEHPSVETMLKLFWFFDKHGLIADDLCFDPQHFMETVAKEHFPDFDMKNYWKTRE